MRFVAGLCWDLVKWSCLVQFWSLLEQVGAHFDHRKTLFPQMEHGSSKIVLLLRAFGLIFGEMVLLECPCSVEVVPSC